LEISNAEKKAKEKSDMDLELIKNKLKWDKENKELQNLMIANSQKKESNEIRAMVSKNKAKQEKEKDDLSLRLMKRKQYLGRE